MRILFFTMSIALFAACSPLTEVTVNDQIVKLPQPPGSVVVSNNLFMDKAEVSNLNWKEYLYWLKSVYGYESETYLNALPDTTAWRTESNYNEPYVQAYFQHPAYSDYPVVGISYKQAVAYAKWRSDRVFESKLIQEEIITPNMEQTADNYFSIEKYYNGEIPNLEPDYKRPYPNYRLPTKTEWEKTAKGLTNDEYGINTNKRYVKKAQGKGNNLFNVKYKDSEDMSITAQTYSFLENDFGIFNMIGNVGEMIAEKGIAKGGSWKHLLVESKISNDLTYEKPTCWLGFRNICEYKYWEK